MNPPADRFIGVISDTHSLLRPEALAALEGASLIIHAGDVGAPEILPRLERIAPVRAIRGNVDCEAWASHLPETDLIEVDGFTIYVLHDLHALDLDPVAASIDLIISGHTHAPRLEEKRRVLYFNPGSAGPRRFKLPVAVGRLEVHNGKLAPTVIELKVT